jgi:outer membrane receptor protein involved in Fe transport
MKKRNRNKRLYGPLIAGGIASTLALPNVSWSQTADATLRGEAAPNATVTAKNVATGVTRRTTAGSNGSYSLIGLSPGTYKVDAGAGTEHTITLTVASVATLDLLTGSAATEGTLEEVIVKATRLVEVKTSEVGATVSLHQIETTPQITRNFLEFADTVPGMVFSVDSNGNTKIQSGAQANSAINVYIDGVGQKNYVKTGGISGQAGFNNNGDPGNPFPQLAIGEYKIITSNYKAEYDQISSAAITAKTKSGTNQFHGEVFGDYTSDSYRAATPAELAAGGTKSKSSSKEYGMAVGGPIIQDMLHYFVTWEHKGFTLPNSVNLPSNLIGQPISTSLPAGVFSQFGPSTNPFEENLYFGKLDFEPGDRDRIELSTKLRRESEVVGAQGQTAASAAFDFKNEESRIALSWQHSADHWTNEGLWTYEKTVDNPTQRSDVPAITYTWVGPPQPTDIITINGQDPRQYTDKHQNGWGLQDDLTLNSIHWLGDHTVKMGVKFKSVELVARDSSDAAKFWYSVDATGTASQAYKAVFGRVEPGLPLAAVSDNKQYGIYLQDDWAVNDHLTLNLGVRWDYEVTPSFEKYRTPARTLTALGMLYPNVTVVHCGPTDPDPHPVDLAPNCPGSAALHVDGQLPIPTPGETYTDALKLGGININDYISNGHNRSSYKGEFQPRLGFSYDINADQKHVVFGGVGRAFDRNLFDKLQLENSKNALSQPEIDFYGGPYSVSGCSSAANASSTCVAWDPNYVTNPKLLQNLGNPGGEVNMFPNSMKVPYADQFSLGMRNKVGDWNTSASVTRIDSYNGLLGVLGNRYADGSWAAHGCGLSWGGSPAQWCSSGVPGISNLILWENGQETRTTEVLLSAEKPYTVQSGWSATFAYTYTSATQNRLYTDGYGFDLPHIADYPFTLSSAVARHRLVATGSIDGPWGLSFAGKLTLASPIPVTVIAGCPTNGVSCNAFGTNAYPVADSIPQTFGYKTIDAQVSKDFKLPLGISPYLRLDILNLANSKNYDSGSANYPYPNRPSYNTTGPILGVTRTLKLTFGVKF